MRSYSVIRNFKKFKSSYKEFVVFIKNGKYYYTFDGDAKIMMYIYKTYKEELSFKIDKEKFKYVLAKLHEEGLNVVLAGWKNSQEYYTEKMSRYRVILKYAKKYYNATKGSIISSI